MTAEEKLAKIEEYFKGVSVMETEYPEDLYSECGGNFDDAWSLGIDYATGWAAEFVLGVINDTGQ